MNVKCQVLASELSCLVTGESGRIARLKGGSTGVEEILAKKIIKDSGIEKIIFAAKKDEMNGAKLVFLAVYSDNLIFIADSFSLNYAREPRKTEVDGIIEAALSREDIELMFIVDKIEDTSGCEVAEAYNTYATFLKKSVGKLDESSLQKYMSLLKG